MNHSPDAQPSVSQPPHRVSRRVALHAAVGGGIVAIAASATRVSAEATSAPMVPVVDRWAAAWNAHNPEQMAELFTDDGIYEDLAFGFVMQGKQGLPTGSRSPSPGLRTRMSTSCTPSKMVSGPPRIGSSRARTPEHGAPTYRPPVSRSRCPSRPSSSWMANSSAASATTTTWPPGSARGTPRRAVHASPSPERFRPVQQPNRDVCGHERTLGRRDRATRPPRRRPNCIWRYATVTRRRCAPDSASRAAADSMTPGRTRRDLSHRTPPPNDTRPAEATKTERDVALGSPVWAGRPLDCGAERARSAS
jgi:hypothetical protein